MPDFLSDMAVRSRSRAERAKAHLPPDANIRRALDRPRGPVMKLSQEGFDVIAEIKREAPSVGSLNELKGEAAMRMVTEQRAAYTKGGAAAISVLTEPERFRGDLEDLDVASSGATVPVMRKDFLVDPYQVYEARAHGASGVLLIARLLDEGSAPTFLSAAAQTGQFVLLEVFGLEEMGVVEATVRVAERTDVTLLVGVNARNLETLDVDTERFATLAPHLPSHLPLVAESGLSTISDVEQIASLGYNLALVGTSLMRSDTPQQTVAEFVGAGRRAVQQCASE